MTTHVPLWMAVGDLVVPMLVLAVAIYGLSRIRRTEYVIDCARGRHDPSETLELPKDAAPIGSTMVEVRACKRCGARLWTFAKDWPPPQWRLRPPSPDITQFEHRN